MWISILNYWFCLILVISTVSIYAWLVSTMWYKCFGSRLWVLIRLAQHSAQKKDKSSIEETSNWGMCICPHNMDHQLPHAINATAVLASTPETVSTTTMVSTAVIHVAAQMGPHFARQVMRYNNLTVIDKVPDEMLHLVGEHWYEYLSEYGSSNYIMCNFQNQCLVSTWMIILLSASFCFYHWNPTVCLWVSISRQFFQEFIFIMN